jgi:hypothetical protein
MSFPPVGRVAPFLGVNDRRTKAATWTVWPDGSEHVSTGPERAQDALQRQVASKVFTMAQIQATH